MRTKPFIVHGLIILISLLLLTSCLEAENTGLPGTPIMPTLPELVAVSDSAATLEERFPLYELPDTLKANRPHEVDFSSLERWQVERVVDGDTLIVTKGEIRDRLRLLGVDAPESSSNPDLSRQTKEGDIVSEIVADLITGRDVFCEFDVSPRDQYGRLLAYVWLDEDLMLNESLVFSGLVKVVRFRPNTAYYDYFLELNEEAKTRRLGFYLEPGER